MRQMWGGRNSYPFASLVHLCNGEGENCPVWSSQKFRIQFFHSNRAIPFPFSPANFWEKNIDCEALQNSFIFCLWLKLSWSPLFLRVNLLFFGYWNSGLGSSRNLPVCGLGQISSLSLSLLICKMKGSDSEIYRGISNPKFIIKSEWGERQWDLPCITQGLVALR